MATLPTEVELTESGVTNAQLKVRFAAFRNFVADLLGIDSSDKSSARTALGVAAAPRVIGLIGNVNATTPLTKYDLSASAVVMRDASGGMITQYATGTKTCDLGLAGSAANGRDQAAAFTANSWVYLYFIWNGTTLATIASASATAPTLPSGYTHYAFATALRWNASSNIVPMFARGSKTTYDMTNGSSVNRVVSLGTATTMTSVNCAGLIPPIATRGIFNFIISVSLGSTGVVTQFVRYPGSAITGSPVASVGIQVAGLTGIAVNTLEYPVSTSQTIEYMLSGGVASGGGIIDVDGFVVPNGDC